MASEQDIINTLIAEALGQGEEGMRLVAETILNRSAIRDMTPAEVVRQRAQYTGYSNPGPAAVRAQQDPQAISAAQAAWNMAQGPDDPTQGADHYYAPGTISQPYWAKSMQPTMQGGGHNFYSSTPVPQRARTAPTPMAQSGGLAAGRAVTSPSGGNTALQNALGQLATRRGNAVTPATMQGRATTVATYPTTRAPTSASDRTRGQTAQSLTTPGAVSRSIAQTRQDPTLAAAIAARAAPTPAPRSTVSASDMARGSEAQTRNVATTVALYPTQTPARLPSISSGVGAAPATRSVPTSRVVAQNNNIAQQRNEQAVQRATAAPVARSVPMATGVTQSYAGQDRAPAARVPGPAAAVKTAERLPASPATPLGFNPAATGGATQSGGLSRDALARQAQYNATALNPSVPSVPTITARQPAPTVRAPVPMQQRPAIQPQVAIRQPVAVPVVRQPQMVMGAAPAPAQRAPLNVLVQGSNTVQPAPAPMSAIAALQAQGLTSAQAYSALTPNTNHDAASRVNSKSGSRFDSGADSFY